MSQNEKDPNIYGCGIGDCKITFSDIYKLWIHRNKDHPKDTPCSPLPHNDDPDPVNHPKHYNIGKYEAIEVIHDWKMGFNLGNVIKYVARADHKSNPIEDLKKARFYLDDEITRRETCRVRTTNEEIQSTKEEQ